MTDYRMNKNLPVGKPSGIVASQRILREAIAEQEEEVVEPPIEEAKPKVKAIAKTMITSPAKEPTSGKD